MLDKLLAQKLKDRYNGMPVPVHELRATIPFTRLNRHDARLIVNDLKRNHLITIHKKQVYWK